MKITIHGNDVIDFKNSMLTIQSLLTATKKINIPIILRFGNKQLEIQQMDQEEISILN
jgi:hypothetical protein